MRNPKLGKLGCPGCVKREEEIKILNKKISKIMIELDIRAY